jgi:hypothetical protein
MSDLWCAHRQEQLGPDPDEVLARPRKDDPVEPHHYTQFPVEPIEILELLPYNRASAAKYVIRCSSKGGARDAIIDLKKAIWFLNREVRRLERLENITANGQGPSTSAT